MAEIESAKPPVRKLTVKNFSVIQDATLEFGKITVLIGPQSSGKSLLCRLSYFLRYELIATAVDAAKSNFNWSDFETLVGVRFAQWFFPSSWNTSEFQVRIVLNQYSVQISRKNDNRNESTQLIQLDVSAQFQKVYFETSKLLSSQRLGLAAEEQQIAGWTAFASLQDPERREHPIYIPAGRAFFTNNLGAAAMQNPGLDPLTRRFATEINWNPINWMEGLAVGREVPDFVRQAFEQIVRGKIEVQGSEPVFKTQDNRVLPLSLLSSGTQELLPLFNVLDRLVYTFESDSAIRSPRFNRIGASLNLLAPIKPLVYVEEPEAHIFPSTQYELMRIFAWITNDSILNFEWVITTHSPYILSAFNNLLEASQVATARPEVKGQVAAVIPEQYWVRSSDFRAYCIHDGKLESIMDEESGLINGNYLDGVSGEIGSQFDELLRIAYAEE